MRTSFITFVIVIQLAFASAIAQQNPIMVKNVAETEVEVKNPQGVVEKKRMPLDKATPGTEVIYTTTFTNHGSKPAGNIAITNPLPNDTIYVGNSAFGENTDITFSIDGGKSYAPADKLRVKTAEGRERAALPSDYTHIRWAYRGDLPPAKTGSAGFRAVIK
ncbi:MAG: hypothetical protein ACRECQ_08435 [Burkholderiaceae bacterium]